MLLMRDIITIVEAKNDFQDPRLQFHMSVEPNLRPLTDFAHQTRTISAAGARGEAGGEGIYTTRNLRYWATQLAYEHVGDYPRYVYLVWVRDGSDGSIWAAHQDISQADDVVVLTLLGDIGDPDDDENVDFGKIDWLADKWLKGHPQVIAGLQKAG